MQETIPPPRPTRWIAPTLLLLGGACIAMAWILIALYLQRSCGWMAIAAALTSVLMLRLGGMPRTAARPVLAVLATLTIIALVNWTVTATQIGFALGLNPFDSAMKLGADYAWTLARLANQITDWLWMAASLAVAALAAR